VETDDAVPRETVAEGLARELAGDQAETLAAYAALLRGEGALRGLIGPRETGRVWERHLLNSIVLGELLHEGDRVVDVGSGAGLPGIPLALSAARPQMTLLEPLLRRTTFLELAVQELHLDPQVTVVRARAENAPTGQRWPVVTARAVAPLDALARLTRPLLRPGGRLLALKGASASQELDAARSSLSAIGFRHGRVVQCGPPDFRTTVVELVAGRTARR